MKRTVYNWIGGIPELLLVFESKKECTNYINNKIGRIKGYLPDPSPICIMFKNDIVWCIHGHILLERVLLCSGEAPFLTNCLNYKHCSICGIGNYDMKGDSFRLVVDGKFKYSPFLCEKG